MPELYKIVDDERELHTGTEQEMQLAYMVMAWDKKTLHGLFQDKRLAELEEIYVVPKVGKLKMIKHVEETTTEHEADPAEAIDRGSNEGHRPVDKGEG